MKIAAVVILAVVVLLTLMFSAAVFYSWAWATTFSDGNMQLVRPYMAAVGLLALLAGMALAFGPLLAIPLQSLGIIK